MRHLQFFSVEGMNTEIAARLEALNDRQMKNYGQSRNEIFEGEKNYLQSLPAQPYEWSEWHFRKVGRNYHVKLGNNYYSVASDMVGKQVQVRETAKTIEIYSDTSGQQRLAIHSVLPGRNRYQTNREHMPRHHQAVSNMHEAGYGNWLLTEARRTGQSVYDWAIKCLSSRPFEQQAYHTVRGLLKLGEKHGHELLNATCEAALTTGKLTYGYLRDQMKTQAALKAESDPNSKESIPAHGNIRGAAAYRDPDAPKTTEI